MERRARPRNEANVKLSCRVPARPRSAELQDVSREGCRLRLNGSHAEFGATALIDLPSAPEFPGRVVWINGNIAGIRFDRPIKTATAVALGLEDPAEETATTEAQINGSSPNIEQLLRHWIRRLAACLS